MPEPITNTTTYSSKNYFISSSQESESDIPFSAPNSTVYDPRWTPEMIQKSYDEFLRRFIFANPKGNGIAPEDPSQNYNIYSESFGNSQRLAVLGSDQEKVYDLDDGAASVLKKSNKLFAWWADANGDIQDQSSATDADLDIAFALFTCESNGMTIRGINTSAVHLPIIPKIIGQKIFTKIIPINKLLEEAKNIALSVQENETTTLGNTDILLPSDDDWVWLSPDKVAYNPSYFDPLTMELLGFEDKIIDDGFDILDKVYQTFDHQVPDWCALTTNESGEIVVEDFFNSHQGFDALRVWLRMARYALWGQDTNRVELSKQWCQTLLNDHPNLTVEGYRNQYAVSMELMSAIGAGDQNRYLELSSELLSLYDIQTGLFGWPDEQNMIFNQYYAVDAAATLAGFAPEF